jgi:hypothetical protein
MKWHVSESENVSFHTAKTITAVERATFDAFPQTLDPIRIGRVRRRKQQFDPHRIGQGLHHGVVLMASIVENRRDRPRPPQRRDPSQQFAHRSRVHGRRVGHRRQFSGDGLPGSQNIESLPPRSRSHEDSRKRPQTTQKSAVDKMGGVHEKHVSVARLSLIEPRLQFFIEKGAVRNFASTPKTIAVFAAYSFP